MSRCLSIFKPLVFNFIGQVGHSLLKFKSGAMDNPRYKRRSDRRIGRSMQPRIDTPIPGQSTFEILGAYGVVIAVPDVILTGPDYLNGSTRLFGKPGSLQNKIRFGFSAETTSKKSNMDRHVLKVNFQ